MAAKYAFADFEVDGDEGSLKRRGYSVPLQDQPFRLLILLVDRAGTVVTREEIQAHLWPGNTYVEFDKSLRVAVSKVREALRDSAAEPIYIETLPRRGYRFIAPVTCLAPESATPATGAELAIETSSANGSVRQEFEDDPLPAIQAETPALRARQRVLARLALAAVVLTAVVLVPLFLLRSSMRHGKAPSVAAHPIARRSIAIIGLRNLNGSAQDGWMATGLAEMLSTELAASDRLRVISGEEIALAGLAQPLPNSPSHETLAQMGKKLGADMILFGSYTVSREHGSGAPSLRLDLRLENLSSDEPPVVLMESGPVTDLFALVSASGSQLRSKFDIGEVSPGESIAVRKTLPADPRAAQYYSEGLAQLRNFDPSHARDLLENAVRIEPGHAGTHLALADAWHAMGYDREARDEATKAVALGAGLPRQDLLNMQGELALYSDDWSHAADIFRSLLTFYPDNVEYGLRLAQSQTSASELSAALSTIQGLRNMPLSKADAARVELAEAQAHFRLGDFQQSVNGADRAIAAGTELDNKIVRAQALWIKATGLERLGNSGGSMAASAEAQSLYRDAGDKQGVALAIMSSGDVLYDEAKRAEARQTFQAALEIFSQIGQRRYVGIMLERIGNTFYDEGALAESQKFYERAFDAYRELHWDAGIASILGNIANVQDVKGDIAGARKSNSEALAIFERTGQKRGACSTLSNMGNLEVESGSLDRAENDFKRAADLCREIKYARGVAGALLGQGDVLFARNDIAGASRQYQSALETIKGMDEPTLVSAAQFGLGVTALSSGVPEKGAQILRQVVVAAGKENDHGMAAVALAWLSRAMLQQHRSSEALAAADKAVAEAHAQFGPQIELVATLSQARVRIALGNKDAARQQLRSAGSIATKHGYAPLDLESRMLLARCESSPAAARVKIKAVADEASTRGWKQLAADAAAFLHP